jgi:hypothetical protein
MDGLARTVGNGIAGLVATAFDVIGGTLRSIVNSATGAMPAGYLLILVFAVLLLIAWVFARR